MNLFTDHTKLFGAAFALFTFLTFLIAIDPALWNQENNAPLPNAVPLSEDERKGKDIYISNGCVACHTQQVRNVEMDEVWGTRPSIAADYAGNERTDFWRNTATLMGTERTGPDLANTGSRQSSVAWNLLHLYQPRAVVSKSVMPAYPWLFNEKDSVSEGEIEVVVPASYRSGISGSIVATEEAMQLVSYLLSLKQTPLPDSRPAPEFLYQREKDQQPTALASGLDGKSLYTKYCANCHQENGEGLPGAFPPLKGSQIVLGDDLELFATIILKGYDARPEYAVMTAVGIDNELTLEELVAIMDHERTSWGNDAERVDAEEVKKIMDFIKLTSE